MSRRERLVAQARDMGLPDHLIVCAQLHGIEDAATSITTQDICAKARIFILTQAKKIETLEKELDLCNELINVADKVIAELKENQSGSEKTSED